MIMSVRAKAEMPPARTVWRGRVVSIGVVVGGERGYGGKVEKRGFVEGRGG